MSQPVRPWLENDGHLPECFKDFHDQKDVFKTLWRALKMEGAKGYEGLAWTTAHCFTIDKFLWFMAIHGYTLQRSRADVEFQDLRETVQAFRTAILADLRAVLGQGKETADEPTH